MGLAYANVAEREGAGVVALQAMCPFFARPKLGYAANLLIFTLASQSGIQSSYSSSLMPFSQCST
ncbi:MAG: hypothetical protein DMG14_23665 [Acidobacteria bacterium]|nr:MAG: hypothetical protein DMG14_23665 [Acidobacteriota bacterium]